MSKVRILLLNLFLALLLSCGTVKEGKRQNVTTSSNYSMVFVKGGTAKVGIEGSGHKEEKVKDFFIGETEVTQKLWKEIMGENPSCFKGDDLPVENVSWNDCQEFIHRLNVKTGQNYRLPTVVEWEYAICNTNYKSCDFFDGNLLNNMIQCLYNNKPEANIYPHGVMQGNPNKIGLYGMEDNVWEWCSDGENNMGYTHGMDLNEYKIIKGVVKDNGNSEMKYIIRYPFHCGSRSGLLGLRLVLDK